MGRGLDGLISRYEESCAVLRDRSVSQNSGGYCVGETPLPIPNRAVKPHSADGTWIARAWESRSPPVSFTSRPLGGSSWLRAPRSHAIYHGRLARLLIAVLRRPRAAVSKGVESCAAPFRRRSPSSPALL